MGQNFVLSAWSNANNDFVKGESASVATQRYLVTYFTLGIVSIGVGLTRSALLILGSISASRKLHRQLLAKVVHLPMSFFDSQPTGRLLNRFTKDTEAVDVTMSGTVSSALTCFVSAGLSLFVVLYVSPLVVFAIVPLAAFYYKVSQPTECSDMQFP